MGDVFFFVRVSFYDFNPRPMVGYRELPLVFLNICQPDELSVGNLQYLLGYQFYTSCANNNFVTTNYHRLAGNDVRVTSCLSNFDAK